VHIACVPLDVPNPSRCIDKVNLSRWVVHSTAEWAYTGQRNLLALQVPKDIDPRDGVSACATEICKLLGKLKDPVFIKDTATGVAKMQSQVAWGKKSLNLPAARVV